MNFLPEGLRGHNFLLLTYQIEKKSSLYRPKNIAIKADNLTLAVLLFIYFIAKFEEVHKFDVAFAQFVDGDK